MGLQSQLSDVSSESILVLTAVLLGQTLSYLHSLILTLLHHLRLCSPPPSYDHRFNVDVALCDQLAVNRDRSYKNDQGLDMDCAVCLNRLAHGDQVRRLPCRHVFHKDCFDGWLHHLNFNCPLCRAIITI